jgi:hypothetical protein
MVIVPFLSMATTSSHLIRQSANLPRGATGSGGPPPVFSERLPSSCKSILKGRPQSQPTIRLKSQLTGMGAYCIGWSQSTVMFLTVESLKSTCNRFPDQGQGEDLSEGDGPMAQGRQELFKCIELWIVDNSSDHLPDLAPSRLLLAAAKTS